MLLKVLLQCFTIRMWICFVLEKYVSVSRGMVDKLISCLRSLLSLKAVNGSYNSINSTLAAQ